mgnify:CR=1 FL=1
MTLGALMVAILLWLTVAGVRGGAFHGQLVNGLAQAFTDAGWSVAVEFPIRLPDGRTDWVDLLARRAERRLAIEVETTPRYVRVNVEKARLLGIPLLIAVPTRRLLAAIERRLAHRAAGAGADSRILLYAQLVQALRAGGVFDFPGECAGNGNGE